MLVISELTFPAGSSPTPSNGSTPETKGSPKTHPILPALEPSRGPNRARSRPRSLFPALRPPHPLPRESTPHACLTKKGGVEGVCSVHGVLLQEAGVDEAALDIPAPLPSCIQHGAPLGMEQKYSGGPRSPGPGRQRHRAWISAWAEGTSQSRRMGLQLQPAVHSLSFQGSGSALPSQPPAC